MCRWHCLVLAQQNRVPEVVSYSDDQNPTVAPSETRVRRVNIHAIMLTLTRILHLPQCWEWVFTETLNRIICNL